MSTARRTRYRSKRPKGATTGPTSTISPPPSHPLPTSLESWCGANEHDILGQDFTRFIDRGANVLAIAHLDKVVTGDCHYVADIAVCPQLDDRLGAWVIHDVLPRFGITTDVLFTTDEECGQSTASTFTPPEGKHYNWMFSFDRAGTDVVTYQYDEKDWLAALRKASFQIGRGSYSCIDSADHLGICGVNVGVAYYEQHTKHSFALMSQLYRQITAFKTFWLANREIKFAHECNMMGWDYPATSMGAATSGLGKVVSKIKGKLTESYCQACGLLDWWCECWKAEQGNASDPYCPECYEDTDLLDDNGTMECLVCGTRFVMEDIEALPVTGDAALHDTSIKPDNPDPDEGRIDEDELTRLNEIYGGDVPAWRKSIGTKLKNIH